MDAFYTLASVGLLVASIYVLGKANGWSTLKASAIAIGALALPSIAMLFAFQMPLPPIVAQTILGIGPVVIMIVLFALSKSVANKVGR